MKISKVAAKSKAKRVKQREKRWKKLNPPSLDGYVLESFLLFPHLSSFDFRQIDVEMKTAGEITRQQQRAALAEYRVPKAVGANGTYTRWTPDCVRDGRDGPL